MAEELPLIRVPFSKSFEPGRGMNPCCICGREVKNPRKWVHVVDGGGSICDPEHDWKDGSSDLGLQAVGSDCLRRNTQLKPYVIDWNPDE